MKSSREDVWRSGHYNNCLIPSLLAILEMIDWLDLLSAGLGNWVGKLLRDQNQK